MCDPNTSFITIFLQNLVSGIGWAVGATVGFVIFLTLLTAILKKMGGIPFVGKWAAKIIESVDDSLKGKIKVPGK